ncbi:response regulator transcription factor [Kitasatospora paracochleata]|uniref:Two-component system copper resistance phosphate regulon response regulator CusR n=1 Tax=Kitasatospora paracochleata TaxID=58354 RepID=A0ABT1J387_9ACTN|nr:response regulator transcription factor [Kitasatospora paracochleata]MCP2311608.1 two-component system copper resistance phosphate regulon response regulator CusR [Kitasatospora paracochleata]
MRVLVVEDDPELGPVITRGLRETGFAVDFATDLADADFKLAVNTYDCLVADRTLPDGDALTLVSAQRKAGSTLPVLLLTALDAVSDRVAGFEHGADDYLVKPFAFAELNARVRTLCRRSRPARLPELRVGTLELDLPRRRVRRDGVLLTLTAKEFSVLEVLMLRADEVVTRTELIERCWDEQTEPLSNVVDVLIGQLRRKLGPPELISTVRGVGYRLADPATDR